MNDYYKTPGIREICHAVKQRKDIHLQKSAIQTIADYMLSLGVVDSNSILVPAPQHTGKAEYTKEICSLLSNKTGAKIADVLKCNPHIPLYEQKQCGKAELNLISDGEIPFKGNVYFVDNVISTGLTYKKACETLGYQLIPLVYAIDTTAVEREVYKICLSF